MPVESTGMFYRLSGALKSRLVLELQNSFVHHPVFEKIVPNIQSKYSFEARPQYGIVVKGGGGNRVALSADNFLGNLESHVMLAYNKTPAFPIEWVREDSAVLAANNGVMPLMPGVYYLEILKAPTNVSEPGQFVVDPLLTVTQEAVRVFTTGAEYTGNLRHPPYKGTVRLYENAYYMLKEGVDYTINYDSGEIKFITQFAPKERIYADYRFATTSIGPIDFYWNRVDTTTLGGVVMAFGKRAKVGDTVAIVVTEDRVNTAHVYGGKFEYTFDLDIIASDVTQMEEMADLTLMYLLLRKPELEAEGIELLEISAGGEAEEQKDETADEFFYTAPISVQLRADWEVHIPLPLTISQVTPTGLEMTSSQLLLATAPIFQGRNNDFERIT